MTSEQNKTGLREYGLICGTLPRGASNSISDVPGIKVGHFTIAEGELQTGLTVLLPHNGNMFKDKLSAACKVINGFGKAVGLVQVEELGLLESPIFLTNTFSVAACIEGGLDFLLSDNPDIAVSTGSANVVVLECNDAYLSDMRRMAIKRADVAAAINNAKNSNNSFMRGAIGAGRGMSCFGLKGGIGTSSRIIYPENEKFFFNLGVLVLSNFGRLEDLTILGRKIGKEIETISSEEQLLGNQGMTSNIVKTAGDSYGTGKPGDGSVIVVLATDAPLDSRQLKRLCMRAASGLARTGAIISGGSGEIVLAFSTANKIPHYPEKTIMTHSLLHEELLDKFFAGVTEGVEEAVLDSLFCADTVIGRAGHIRYALKDFGLFTKAESIQDRIC